MASACSSCGATVVAGGRYCHSCGALLPRPPAPLSERFAAPASYTPPHLAQRILATRGALEGEHKQVTVMFCDIAESTPLAERLGPEAMYDLLNRFFDVALAEVHRFEGTVNQFLGDGFMALFGAPIAVEHHERQAVLAAIAVREAVRTLPGRLPPELASTARLTVRIGINTGSVVVGKIGDNLRMDYTAVGDTTNVAARLQSVTGPDTIVISATTAQRVRDVFELEDAENLSLKGKSEPVHTARVIGVRSAHADEASLAGETLSAFVAREHELAALHDALGEAMNLRGLAVGIVGEPGMGKSRLLHEFHRSLSGRPVTYLEGHCLPYGRTIPYLPIVDLLRGGCRLVDTDTPEQVAAKVRETLTDIGLDIASHVPYLLRLLGHKEGGEEIDALSPEMVKQRTLDVVRQFCLRGSRRRPMVLVIEDMHWIDQSSEELLASTAEVVGGAAILILATYRPGYSAPWIGKSYATQIALRPLPDESGRSLVESLLPAGVDARRMAAEILARGEGNPLFLEELTRSVADRALERAPLAAVPTTLRGVLAARIDRLSNELKHVIQLASVIGREFTVELLERVWDGPGPVRPLIEQLVRLELIHERSWLDEPVCMFKHALTRDAAYESLLETRRRRYHVAVGRALESLHAGRQGEIVELLAHHFGRGDEDDPAVEYAIAAAERAQHRWANAEALALAESAIARLATMPDTPANRLRRIDAVIKQAEVRFALGQQAEHIQALSSIQPLVEASADPARRAAWDYWTGFLHSFTGGRPDISIAHCRRAAELASQVGLEDIHAYANCCLAHVSVLAGDLRGASAAGELALPMFEQQRNLYWACRTLWGMSMAANARGQWERGLDLCERARTNGTAAGDNRLIVVGWWRTGSTLIFQGRAEQGIECCDRALTLSPGPYDATMIRAVRAYGHVKIRRDLPRAVADLEEATAWFERSNLRYTWTYFTLWLAEGRLRLGHAQQAQGLLKRALEVAEHLGYRHLEGVALRMLGESLLPTSPADAAAPLARAVVLLEDVGAENDLAKALVVQAQLPQEPPAAPLERALGIFERLGTLDEIESVRGILRRSAQ